MLYISDERVVKRALKALKGTLDQLQNSGTVKRVNESIKELTLLTCETCHGTGKCDDSAPGDIWFKEWPCPTCSKEKGIKSGNV